MATWSPLDGAKKSVTSTQLLTGEAAPSSAADGMDLGDVGKLVLVVQAPGVETFDGTGHVRCYFRSSLLAQYVRLPSGDASMDDATGLNIFAFPTIDVPHCGGQLAFILESVGHSGAGTTGTLYQLAIDRYRGFPF